jgi:transcriptional regulator with PAS, ATPase and Fis domain
VTIELETTRRERDLYRSLLDFADHDDLETLLQAALGVLVAHVSAREVMIEVIDDAIEATSHVVAHGCERERMTEISSFVSRGIIGEAMATGKTIVTANAAEDPRFLAFESVQRNQLEAVLCAPIGKAAHVGVVYLQGKQGTREFQPYDAAVQSVVELVARALSGPVERLLDRTEPASAPSRAARRTSDPDDPFAAIRGRSQAMEDVVERLRLAAPLDVHVLLTGPSGVGKTLLANAVHCASRRRGGAFVEINCATLPEALLENELFGAEPGAHSAVTRSALKGKIEAAEGGTLFLDEIAELAPGAQGKLLQLLQSKTYYRLGGTQPRRADVRVVAATNVNLQAAIAEKKFREDLYYRLQVLELRIPTLAERTEDLVPLSFEFLRQAVDRHQLTRKSLSPGAIRAIQSAQWPGNVRQLANRIESAAIHAELRGSDNVEGHDMFPDDRQSSSEASATLQSATRSFQRKHILGVLTSTDWNIPDTARILDVSRSHVYNLIRTYELKSD